MVRARHVQYKGPGVTTDDPNDWPQEAQSDIARIQRDHEFLRVLATACQARGSATPSPTSSCWPASSDSSPWTRASPPRTWSTWSSTIHSVDVNTAPQLTFPVAVDQFGNYDYQGGGYGDIEFPAEPQDHAGHRPVPRADVERRDT